MSDTPSPLGPPGGLGPRRWGQRWIELLVGQPRTGPTSAAGAPEITAEAIDRGRAYALHDWQLEATIDKGMISGVARSGPRIRHEVELTVDTLDDNAFDGVLGLIAASGARTAALAKRELDLNLVDEATELGVSLLPDAAAITYNCSCRDGNRLCKHASAVLVLAADTFDSSPLELLLLRGRTHPELVDRVNKLRRDLEAAGSMNPPRRPIEISAATDAAAIWEADEQLRSNACIPPPLALTPSPGQIPDWGGPPPARSPFTAIGLASIARDGVDRAHAVLAGQAESYLSLDRASDVARRAGRAIEQGSAARLAANAALTPHELRARLTAWEIAGAEGVGVIERNIDIRRVDADTQHRQAENGKWFRFEKPRGRWQLTAGPFERPEDDCT